MFAAEHAGAISALALPTTAQAVAGVLAGFGIGVIAAIMGVAGGELLIPTIVLLYGVDPKLAGSLSLLVSLPTMVMAFFRYSRNQAFGSARCASLVCRGDGGRLGGRCIPGCPAARPCLRGRAGPHHRCAAAVLGVKVWSHGT